MVFRFNNFNLMVYLVCCLFTFQPVNSDADHKSIRPISCSDSKGNTGTCMFSLACRQSKGKPIGICKDTIYAGSCCQLPGDIIKPDYGTGSTLSEMLNFIEKPSIERVNDQSNKSTTTLDTSGHDVKTTTTTQSPSQPSFATTSQTLPTPAAILTTLGVINTTRYMATTFLPLVTSDLNNQDSESETSLQEDLTLSPDFYTNLNAGSGFNDSEPATEFTISFETITEIGFTSTSWNESATYEYTESSVNDTTIPESFPSSPPSVTTQSISPPSQFPASPSPSSSSASSSLNLSIDSVGPATNISFSTSNIVSSHSTNTFESTTISTTTENNTSSSSQSISSSQSLSTTPASQSTPSTSILSKITTQRPYDNRLDCGISPLKSMARVVGGRNAHFGEWPWQVLIKEATWLGLWMKTKCGGVLIDHRWVLTAAHCQPGFWGSLLVVVGEYDLTSDVENLKPIQKPVKRMIVHRNYNPLTFENDIALMELESPFDVQPHVVPICLPEPWEDFVGQVAHVAGWGKLSYGGPIPSILQVVKLPILANDVCQEMFNKAGHDKEIKPTFMCAGFNDGGKDSCEGDSGGPLMVQRANGHWVLAGTVSHGIKCAEPNLPGVYMRTTAYRLWIDNIINKTSAKG